MNLKDKLKTPNINDSDAYIHPNSEEEEVQRRVKSGFYKHEPLSTIEIEDIKSKLYEEFKERFREKYVDVNGLVINPDKYQHDMRIWVEKEFAARAKKQKSKNL